MNEQYLFIEKYVRNVFFLTDCGSEIGTFASISGTCFLVKFENAYYVITAKHVLQDFNIKDLKVLLDPHSEDDEKRHRALAFESAFTFNGDTGAIDYDNDCDDVCILKVHNEEPPDLLDPFFFSYISPSCRDFAKNAQLIIAGFPTCEQEIGDGREHGVFGAIYLRCSRYERDQPLDFKFRAIVTPNCVKDFDGFSGAPIFCILNDGTRKISGMVIRGSAQSGIFHCIDFRLFEAALIQKKRIDKEKIKPDSISN